MAMNTASRRTLADAQMGMRKAVMVYTKTNIELKVCYYCGHNNRDCYDSKLSRRRSRGRHQATLRTHRTGVR